LLIFGAGATDGWTGAIGVNFASGRRSGFRNATVWVAAEGATAGFPGCAAGAVVAGACCGGGSQGDGGGGSYGPTVGADTVISVAALFMLSITEQPVRQRDTPTNAAKRIHKPGTKWPTAPANPDGLDDPAQGEPWST